MRLSPCCPSTARLEPPTFPLLVRALCSTLSSEWWVVTDVAPVDVSVATCRCGWFCLVVLFCGAGRRGQLVDMGM